MWRAFWHCRRISAKAMANFSLSSVGFRVNGLFLIVAAELIYRFRFTD